MYTTFKILYATRKSNGASKAGNELNKTEIQSISQSVTGQAMLFLSLRCHLGIHQTELSYQREWKKRIGKS